MTDSHSSSGQQAPDFGDSEKKFARRRKLRPEDADWPYERQRERFEHPETVAEAIVGTIHEPLLVLGSDLKVKLANPAFYEHFEVEPEQTTGRKIYELGNRQWDIPELRRLLEEVLPNNQVFKDFEVEHEFEHIGRRVMLVNCRRLDHVQLILLGIRDVTEQKERESELREAKETAEEANRAKVAFMATVSHELRTPLTAIIGYTELLREGVPEAPAPGVQAQVERIDYASRQLRMLIEEVLIFSRIEAGHESLEISEFSTDNLLDEIRAVIEPLASDASLDLSLNSDDAPERLRADSAKLRQVLLNLLGNAIKFTDEGRIGLRISAVDDELLFQVFDTGCGIEPEDQDDLFEPFWQSDTTRPGASGGTGLGLTIAKRYAEMLSGTVTVKSSPGEGSTFTLRLPGEQSMTG